MKPNLIYIDEEPRALDICGRRLQKAVGEEVAVIAIEPELSIGEMIEKVESYSAVISIVIDQKLFATGTAQYTGTELAAALRRSDQITPIYILTNYSGDVDGELGSIEYVLSKADLGKAEKFPAIAARLRRHLNVFSRILDERENRFELLLRKHLESALNEKEVTEFSLLKYEREKKDISSTLISSRELSKRIEIAEATLAEIYANLKVK